MFIDRWAVRHSQVTCQVTRQLQLPWGLSARRPVRGCSTCRRALCVSYASSQTATGCSRAYRASSDLDALACVLQQRGAYEGDGHIEARPQQPAIPAGMQTRVRRQIDALALPRVGRIGSKAALTCLGSTR